MHLTTTFYHSLHLHASIKMLSTTHSSLYVITHGAKVSLYAIFLLCILTAYTMLHTLTINFSLVLSDGHTQLQSSTSALYRQFMPSVAEGALKLSRMTAILLIFQVDDQHEKITDVYIGLVVHRVEFCLYAPEKILDFVSDIEVDLKAVHDALKAGGDPGKRCAFCLFVNNYGGIMSVTMDPPYCLIYPMSYMKDMEPDHFDTHNNPARTCMHHCICHATPQHMNDDPRYHRSYDRSHLILPRGAQYKG